jgi:hypothetical protein
LARRVQTFVAAAHSDDGPGSLKGRPGQPRALDAK